MPLTAQTAVDPSVSQFALSSGLPNSLANVPWMDRAANFDLLSAHLTRVILIESAK